MSVIALDTSCLVAAVCSWHEHHDATRSALERRMERRDRVIMVAHALVETYSVLTRLPHPHRFSPQDALTVLESNWGSSKTIVLTPSESWRFLRRSSDEEIAGGLLYDALIAFCARKGRADELWTWNVGHFHRLATPGVRIASPGDAGT